MSSRRTILFSGRVQGVGFRYATHRIAAEFAVAGTVRNLADGRVELVAEGDSDELGLFVGAIQEEMSGYISHVQVSESPATGEFNGFHIIH